MASGSERWGGPQLHDPLLHGVALRLLDLGEQTTSLSSAGLKARVSVHLSGMNDLLDTTRGFLAVTKRTLTTSSNTRGLRAAFWMWVDAPRNAVDSPCDSQDSTRTILDDPALVALLRLTGHRCSLLGASGGERCLVAVRALDEQTEVVLGFDRALPGPVFSERDRETLLFAVQRQGSFYRRIARELGAFGAERLLSPRERDILELLLTGLSEKEMATQLNMTTRSVHQRVTTLYRNFGVRSRPELMALLLHNR